MNSVRIKAMTGRAALALAVCALAAGLCEAAPQAKAVTADYDWHDGLTLGLEGRGFAKEAAPYTRLPERFKSVVTPKVWGLSQTSIGFNARFVTDSDEVVLRWQVKPASLPILYMSPVCHAGVDVYARDGKGPWRHVTCGAPEFKSGEGELRVRWRKGEECLVYLPVRARPQAFSIGVKKGCSFAKAPAHVTDRPVVIYGTSIVNGGSASRPGLIFTSIMSRLADVEVVNLGFSGAAKMELPMADLVAEIDASLYILDCEWNMGDAVCKANFEPFVRRFKELRPDTPVLVCGGCTELAEPRSSERITTAVLAKLRAEDPKKWANWSFLSGVDQLPKTDDCTHDHCHPNDLGYVFMGRVYAEKITSILAK